MERLPAVTHVPTTSRQYSPKYLASSSVDARNSRLALESAFRSVVVDGPAGILTNMDIAAETARATTTVGIVLTHWSGVIRPFVAAWELAGLDRLSRGQAVAAFPPRARRPRRLWC